MIDKSLQPMAMALAALLCAAAAREITVGVSFGHHRPRRVAGRALQERVPARAQDARRRDGRYVILDDEIKPDNAAKNARKFVTGTRSTR